MPGNVIALSPPILRCRYQNLWGTKVSWSTDVISILNRYPISETTTVDDGPIMRLTAI